MTAYHGSALRTSRSPFMRSAVAIVLAFVVAIVLAFGCEVALLLPYLNR